MTSLSAIKPRVLTGDTPTGRLHLGHWVGSLKKRVELQATHDCFFIIANLHAFTTCPEQGKEIQKRTIDIALDYLAAGIDPNKSTIFIQSDVPAIAELTYLFSMLVSFARVMRNPTLKEELNSKGLTAQHSFGFTLYPVGQVADILAFKPTRVPVGKDQLPHLEMTNEVVRLFNKIYCGVDSSTSDDNMILSGGLFSIIQPEPDSPQRLVGIGSPNKEGILPKMSKSLNNAIYLSDSEDIISQKIKKMYTDPQRIHATDPGRIENNPLWQLHDAFNPDVKWVEEAKARYQKGTIGDVSCKEKLIEIIIELTKPIRQKIKEYEKDPQTIVDILRKGKIKANEVANQTLLEVKERMYQCY